MRAFRDIADVEAMIGAASSDRRAVVIGGGLLGLEAAWGLKRRGMSVALVHLMPTLMERQLDAAAGNCCSAISTRRGIAFFTDGQTEEILGADRAEACAARRRPPISGRSRRPRDRHPAQHRSRPQGAGSTSIAASWSATTWRRAIRDIYAVGECVEHRGQVFGLVAPIWEQAKVCGARLAGDTDAVYVPPPVFTSLKITGVDVFSAGALAAADATDDEITLHDAKRGLYKKVVLRDDRLSAACSMAVCRRARGICNLMRDKSMCRRCAIPWYSASLYRRHARRGTLRRAAGVPVFAGAAVRHALSEVHFDPPWQAAYPHHLPLLRRRLRRGGAADGALSRAIRTHPSNRGRLCSKGAALARRWTTAAA